MGGPQGNFFSTGSPSNFVEDEGEPRKDGNADFYDAIDTLLAEYGGYSVNSIIRELSLSQIKKLLKKIRRRQALERRVDLISMRYSANADGNEFTEYANSFLEEEGVLESSNKFLDDVPLDKMPSD